jgi:manganese transport protein
MHSDPYTFPPGATREPPADWTTRLTWLGPGVVITGSIVGSGELILTSALGAAAGFTLLWWLLIACWSKSLVQAELARYIVVTGDTYLRALNRVPGRLPGSRVSWTVWMTLIGFIPGAIGMGGIVGGAGQAMVLLAPGVNPHTAAGLVAVAVTAILWSGSYRRLERTMTVLVFAFVLATLAAAAAMQFTEFRVLPSDLARGLTFEFPVETLVLALAVYGATGVNAAEISTYTYWCIEKGYPGFVGTDGNDPARIERARGWIRVLQADVWVTLLFLTVATVPFFLLGAGVLHAGGREPQGLGMVAVLSEMFTGTLGAWSLWLFGGAAFCILFSSAVAGYGGTARFLPDFLIEFGFLDRSRLAVRRAWIRGYGTVMPAAGFLFYVLFENPVMLLTVGALMGALLLPVQSGATLWLQHRHMERVFRPSGFAHVCLYLIFAFQLLMAALVVHYAIL